MHSRHNEKAADGLGLRIYYKMAFTPNIENKASLILTASVDPCGMHDSPFSPSEREQQYIDALEYYVENHKAVRNIIFAENSGWNLERIKSQFGDTTKIIFLSFNQNNYSRNLGKGYGELKLISDALDSQQLSSSHLFVKITGRLKILNLDLILNQFNESIELMCDTRSIRVRFWNKKHQPVHADSRLLVFTREFFDLQLRNKLSKIDESKGVYLENILYAIVEATKGDNNVIRRFETEPHFLGYGAHMGGKNYSSLRQRIKAHARQVSRKLFPNFEL